MTQAKNLDLLIQKNNQKVSCVLSLNVKKENVVKRILGREICNKCGLIFNKYYKPASEKNHNCDGKCIVKLDCNGECGGSVKNDKCGVCNGDNSSCSDCAGIPNGNNVKDKCGTCDSDDSNDCVQDCAGNWGGYLTIDTCGICGGNNSSCTDKCGVLNGDNSSCADCRGVPNGGTIVDCNGICGGNAIEDKCGKCNGDGSGCLPYRAIDLLIVAIGLISFAFSLTLTL